MVSFLFYRAMAASSSPLLLLFVYLLLPTATSLSFSFPYFNSTTEQFITFQNDTFLNGAISLTKNAYSTDISSSVGRAYYKEPIPLHDAATGELADFTTHFSFIIDAFNETYSGDGLAFFLSPFPSVVPPDSAGGYIGLVERNNSLNESANQIVAVEFDTFQNRWDPSADHVGVDVNSMKSVATVKWNSSIKDGRTANAWISYNATTKNLSVFLTYDENPIFAGNSSLHHIVNLSQILPEEIAVGFSASTGSYSETHRILSWEFSSTPLRTRKKNRVGLIVGLTVSTGLILASASFLCYFLWRKKKTANLKEEEHYADDIDDGEFEKGRGPKKFPFGDLAAATKNFADQLKLGEGGFGSVYRGFLAEPKIEVAIKRVSKESQQGKKEYISEVKIISRLRHRNLVQLVGWCHERKELLLVYEFMPNGSLDSYLYGRDSNRYLSWPLSFFTSPQNFVCVLFSNNARTGIDLQVQDCRGACKRSVIPARGMGGMRSSPRREAEQCDARRRLQCKARRFRFGEACRPRAGIADDDSRRNNGIPGAGDCLDRKASKETDVYSFGVVALELACGRRPVEPKRTEEQAGLVSWVWDLYGRGALLEAADVRLNLEFNEGEMTRLMIVGLWCSHPDSALRPSIRQAMAALKLEAPLPELPSKMPVPTYYAPPMDKGGYTYSSSSSFTASVGVMSISSDYNTTGSDTASATTNSSSTPTMASSSSLFFFFVYLVLPTATSLYFSFPSFNSSTQQFIAYQNDTFFNRVISLTKNEYNSNISASVGRAYYKEQFSLHDAATGKLADFTTHFSFVIDSFNKSYSGDGLAFFLSPFPSVVPPNSVGGSLGLVESSNNLNESANQIVAVEFDTFENDWDPSADHVGVNVNSIKSAAIVMWNSSMRDGRTANAWISYNATTMNLSVFLTYDDNPIFAGNSSLYHIVDLSKILPEEVAIGFSAATGRLTETNNILSWEFGSTPLRTGKKKRIGLIDVMTIIIVFLLAAAIFLWLFLWKKKKAVDLKRKEDCAEDIDDGEFDNGRGPKKIPFGELAAATKNFDDELKLGQGGFGGVYRGFLPEFKLDVAIKRVSKGSQQGKKEYISEVKIISRLRHRNLVQLVGWCHDRKELLLVYQFMPNGSLDSYLYGRDSKRYLSWPLRCKIAVGLACALLYLHEEWEECVVHRDVKPSNVMLDGGFNAKLGDFGLARLVDHERGSQTTMLAGTMGYMAPEIVTTGKASKESDVYSFGVVALELACGRRPLEPKRTEEQVVLVSWVWGLYGRGALLEAADERLNSEFDEGEMTRLMIVGLWCSHPDSALRPSIRQAMAALKNEAPLPDLPSKMPAPMYYAPPLESCRFTYTSSAGAAMGIMSTFSDYTTGSDAASSVATDSSPT
ncbi:hypothetical protein M5K25_014415 [Dendrobium thyrsiflorum]|uniref:non-specific serine/threonine protein kinase n=1 Tax=Dendrobium thyrsiflorum TaxID=117978 RepID=A0ABD0UWD9_DENTH